MILAGLPKEIEHDGERITALRFTRQAEVSDGYSPLIDVGGLPCWPNEPRWEQLVAPDRRAAAYENRLLAPPSVGEARLDRFDAVVLAVPVAELPYVARSVIAARPRWARMIERVQPIQTAAAQLWWSTAPPRQVTATALRSPLETWADLSQTLWTEAWTTPKAVTYLCGPMPTPPLPSGPDEAFVHAQEAAARQMVRGAVAERLAEVWPERLDAGAPRWSDLVGDADGEARLAEQVIRANCAPSERYVVTLPGAPRVQLTAESSGFPNLVLAGDWLYTGLGGSVEGAVVSGMAAARALTGVPAVIPGEIRVARPVAAARVLP